MVQTLVQVLLAVVLLGILVIVHETGHFVVARLSKMRVDLFSIGFGPPLWRVTRGETSYQIAAVPLGGFVQIAGLNPGEEIDPEDPRAYPNRPVWQRLLTIFAGPGINYVFAALMMIGLNLAAGVPVAGHKGAVVGELDKDRPAAQAGMQYGDEIVAINGKHVATSEHVTQMVTGSQGQPVSIEVLREGQPKTFQVKPFWDESRKTWRVGIAISPRGERKHLGAWPAIEDGLIAPLTLTWYNAQMIWAGLHGKKNLEFKGPIGIVTEIKKSINRGWVQTLELVAFLSTLLGFFNLLPFPALDGGRLVFLGWEVVTRRPVNPRVEQWVHTVGIVVLLCLMLPLIAKEAWVVLRGVLVGG